MINVVFITLFIYFLSTSFLDIFRDGLKLFTKNYYA